MSDENERDNSQVLAASVRDVRYFAALLRGVNFGNRATVNISEVGLTVSVEDARTLLGTAYIFRDVFDDYTYNPEALSSSQDSSQKEDEDEEQRNTAFEIPLNTFIECLNVFGTAGGVATTPKFRQWRRDDDLDRDERNDDEAGPSDRARSKASGNARIDQFFDSEKGTGMRMSYAGAGYPLSMLVAEDSKGPTATCEVTTFDPEAHLELPFETTETSVSSSRFTTTLTERCSSSQSFENNPEGTRSSWLRDALSELDPSCEKLTITGNPPPPPGRAARASIQPRLRLQAAGTFGSTEMDYPSDKEVLETCECENTVSFSYRFSHISKTLRALQSSSKTSLRINEEGLLSLQFLMPSPKSRAGGGGGASAFIEFRVSLSRAIS
ncbi:Rad1/Rec1/Rad17 [Sparassis latifolia]